MKFAKETEKTAIDLLLLDLDIGLTFLDVAETTRITETARRNRENAQKSYDTVVSALQAVTLNDEQQALFDRKLTLLRSRLTAGVTL
jgi:hypothetical protein